MFFTRRVFKNGVYYTRMDFTEIFLNESFLNAFSFIWSLYPLWLPLVLAFLFWDAWMMYIRADFFSKQKYVLLEIKLPQNILKSAEGMDTLIASLYDTSGEGTFIARYWDGKTRPWFSLELVSIEGEIKFFMWMREEQKDYVEALIYSQYHEVELHIASDYTTNVTFNPKENDIWACDFKLDKPDVFPIKTYVDFWLDEEQEEFFKVDPLTPVIEYLGSLGPGEQAWYQFVIRAHKKETPVANVWPSLKLDPTSLVGFSLDTSGVSFFKKVDWTEDAKAQIKEILEKSKDKEKGFRNLTEGEKKTIEALERNISKPAFDVGIRALYIATKDAFKKPHSTALTAAFMRPYKSGFNEFKPNAKTAFDYPWQDFAGRKMRKLKGDLLGAYKARGFFYEPIKAKTMVMNSEEIATMYHFPGAVATTPKLARIPSKKAQAPANLPI